MHYSWKSIYSQYTKCEVIVLIFFFGKAFLFILLSASSVSARSGMGQLWVMCPMVVAECGAGDNSFNTFKGLDPDQ